MADKEVPQEEFDVRSLPNVRFVKRVREEHGEPSTGGNIGKQLTLGLAELGTSIPTILGIAGSAGEALLESEVQSLRKSMGFQPSEERFTRRFGKALSSGIDKDLVEIGTKAQKAVEEFVGAGEPQTSGEVAARSIGLFMPIPGARVARAASPLAKFASGFANVTTPMVKVGPKGTRFGPEFVNRAAGQEGIGLGMTEIINTVLDKPTMLPSGSVSPVSPVSAQEAGLPPGAEEVSRFTPRKLTSIDPVHVMAEVHGELERFEVRLAPDDRLELERRVREAEDEELSLWQIVAGTALLAYGGVKWGQHIASKKIVKVAPYGPLDSKPGKVGQFFSDIDPLNPATAEKAFTGLKGTKYLKEFPGILADARRDVSEYIDEAFVDRAKILAQTLRRAGHSEIVISTIVQNSHTDAMGIAQKVWDTGRFLQGTSITTHAGKNLELDYLALQGTKPLFDEGMLAATILSTRRATDPRARSVLWGAAKSDDELRLTLKAARDNPEVSRLMDKFGEVFDSHLEYQVKRGVLTPEDAVKFKATFLNADGTSAYMPLYNVRPRDFFVKLGKAFGIRTDKAKQMDVIGEFKQRPSGDIVAPMNPIEALRQYTIHAIDHANTSAFHWDTLGNLAGIQLKGGKINFFIPSEGKTIQVPKARRDNTGRGTTYIGSGSLDESTDATIIDIIKDASTKKFKDGSINDLRRQFPNEIITVHHKGRLHAFHVPDAHLRAALDMNPQLSAGLYFMNHWKTVFTKLTTGNLSMFAPISSLFSVQQIMLATAAKEGLGPALKVLPDTARGIKEIWATQMSKEIADYLAFRLATNTGIGKMAPEGIEKLRGVLERRFQRSLLNDVTGETGRISTGLAAPTYTGSIANFSDALGQNFGKAYGADEMGLVWRMWKGWNTAMHEGPAFGVMQRRIGQARLDGKEITPQIIREAVDASKSVAGDMRRVGASKFAQMFNASIPFGPAMIQSWNALGSAMKHNPKGFMAGIGVFVGVPTMSELTYNAVLSMQTNPDGSPITFRDAKGKEWTYNDYYWNGFNTQQRIDNAIWFVPGKPPWEALVIPISPEFGLFRGAVIEAADALFNFSNVGALKTANTATFAGSEFETKKISRNHFLASLIRVLDIPCPPAVCAALSLATGTDIRLGPALEQTDDPDDPGLGLSVVRAVPLGTGERITRRSGRTRFVGQTIDTDVAAAMQDLFGSGATLYIAVHEAFATSMRLSEEPGLADKLVEAAGFAGDALGTGLQRAARFSSNPMTGGTLRPNDNDEIAKAVFNRRRSLERLAKDASILFSGALSSRKGGPNVGNAVVLVDDPIYIEVSADAEKVLAKVRVHDEEISKLRRERNIVGNSTTINGRSVSIRERDLHIDAIATRLMELRALQAAEMVSYEAFISDFLTQRYGKQDDPIDISLDTLVPGPNLTPPGSALQVFGKSPPASR